MKIFVIGDTHGRWNRLNEFIEKHQPDIIFQCGDFGYWPSFKEYNLNKLLNQNTKIYFCDGNHEDHWALIKLEKMEIAPNIFYMPRGSTFELPDGRNILFMGGAYSVDKDQRMIGFDWFPEEVITTKDLFNLPNKQIDIVISHTCPTYFDISALHDSQYRCNDPSRKALDLIFDAYQPELWYFGHWHRYEESDYQKCIWIGLDRCDSTISSLVDRTWSIELLLKE